MSSEAALDASLQNLDRVLAASEGQPVLQLSALMTNTAMTAPMREKLKGALAFFHHEAAGGLVLVVAALVALLASNSPLAWLYDGFLHTPVGVRVGDARARQVAAALDQRRPDGDLLFSGGPGDQARVAAGRAVDLRPGGASRRGSHWRHGGTGRHLRGHQHRRSRRAQGLGDTDGHRHRLRRRRAGAAGAAHSLVAEDLPAGARHHRRPRRHRHHRAVLHRQPVAGFAEPRLRRARRAGGA